MKNYCYLIECKWPEDKMPKYLCIVRMKWFSNPFAAIRFGIKAEAEAIMKLVKESGKMDEYTKQNMIISGHIINLEC